MRLLITSRSNSQGFLFNSSQACIAASRLFVHSSIADKFIEGLKARFQGVSGMMGDPNEPHTFLGPLADTKQLERVLGFIETGKSEAKLLVGGERKGDKGAFVEPTIFLNPSKDATIYKDEIFGPVLSVLTFETEEEAIKLANDTSYGLSGELSFCFCPLPTPCIPTRLTGNSMHLHWQHISCSARRLEDQGRHYWRQRCLHAGQQSTIRRV